MGASLLHKGLRLVHVAEHGFIFVCNSVYRHVNLGNLLTWFVQRTEKAVFSYSSFTN